MTSSDSILTLPILYKPVDESDVRKAVDQMEVFLKSADQNGDQVPSKVKEG
jgi:hypothetical protein